MRPCRPWLNITTHKKTAIVLFVAKLQSPNNKSSHFHSIHYSAMFRLSVKLEDISTPERVSAQRSMGRIFEPPDAVSCVSSMGSQAEEHIKHMLKREI